jgi:hypothetical protein
MTPPNTATQSAVPGEANLTTPTKHGRIAAAAVQMIFASRAAGTFITPDKVKSLEYWAGEMCLKTLVRWSPGQSDN